MSSRSSWKLVGGVAVGLGAGEVGRQRLATRWRVAAVGLDAREAPAQVVAEDARRLRHVSVDDLVDQTVRVVPTEATNDP